jgi:hypothetical protein
MGSANLMPDSAGDALAVGANEPPGAGSDRKLRPPLVVVLMLRQSRVPQGTAPSTHQWVTLTAVNDSGTNDCRPGDPVPVLVSEAGEIVTAARVGERTDGVAAERAAALHPATSMVASTAPALKAGAAAEGPVRRFITGETELSAVRLRQDHLTRLVNSGDLVLALRPAVKDGSLSRKGIRAPGTGRASMTQTGYRVLFQAEAV